MLLLPVFSLWNWRAKGSFAKDWAFWYRYWPVMFTAPRLLGGKRDGAVRAGRPEMDGGIGRKLSPVDEDELLHGAGRASRTMTGHWLVLVVLIPQHRHTGELLVIMTLHIPARIAPPEGQLWAQPRPISTIKGKKKSQFRWRRSPKSTRCAASPTKHASLLILVGYRSNS